MSARPSAALLRARDTLAARTLIRNYRTRGHLIAKLDPLGLPRPTPPELGIDFYGLTDADLDKTFSTRTIYGPDMLPLRKVLDRLRTRTVEAAGNGVLAGMLDSINDKTREIQRRIIILPGRAAEGLEQHRAVLAAMRKGNAGKAEELRRANIRSSRDYLERYKNFVL